MLWWVFVGDTVGVEDVEGSVLVGYSDFIKKMYFLKNVMSKLLLIFCVCYVYIMSVGNYIIVCIMDNIEESMRA